MQNDDVRQLADDLDKSPTGEDVSERIIREVVTLQLANNRSVEVSEQTTARIDHLEAAVALLAKLLDSHQAEIEDLKLRLATGGIVQ
ncbi:MAG TPA: hypothetical protein VK638_00215 [Edaphobacter sp.]|nr:hypothetical protein [Edaphobacter sp.]